jgi:hypothetical protein
MTIQTVVNNAAIRIQGNAPATVFSSTTQIAVELRNLVQDVAEDIAGCHDWRDLTKIATFTGDGATETFAKPSDYDRMVQGSSITDPDTWLWGYYAIPTVTDWLRRRDVAWISPGGWILLGGEFQFYPAPVGDAEFPYISNLIVRADNDDLKTAFTADNDSFVLSERLLTLGLIWRYRSQKGLDYSEDMATFEIELSKIQTADKGARVIRKADRLNSFGARIAWPWALG